MKPLVSCSDAFAYDGTVALWAYEAFLLVIVLLAVSEALVLKEGACEWLTAGLADEASWMPPVRVKGDHINTKSLEWGAMQRAIHKNILKYWYNVRLSQSVGTLSLDSKCTLATFRSKAIKPIGLAVGLAVVAYCG